MDEKKLLDLLRQSAEEITPPDSLAPKAIENLLTASAPHARGEQDAPPEKEPVMQAEKGVDSMNALKKTPLKKLHIYRYAGLAAAAVLALVVLLRPEPLKKLEREIGRKAPENEIAVYETATDSDQATAGSGASETEMAKANETTDSNTSEKEVAGTSEVAADSASKEEMEEASEALTDNDTSPKERSATDVTSADGGQKVSGNPAVTETAAEASADELTDATGEQTAEDTSVLSDGAISQESDKNSRSSSPEAAEDNSRSFSPEAAEDKSRSSFPEAAEDNSRSSMPEPAEKAGEASSDGGTFIENPAVKDQLSYAESYQEVYDKLYGLFGASGKYVMYDMARNATVSGAGAVAEMSVEDSAVSFDTGMSTGSASSQNAPDFSETNLQELGVDEGDIVKTDGTWIYILKEDLSFSILRANDGAPALASTTKLDLSGLARPSIRAMYLDGDTLCVLADGVQTALQQDGDTYQTMTNYTTVLTTWDVTDRSQPVLIGTLNQEGRCADSRKVGPYLYLFTDYTPCLADTYDESTIVPRINGELVPADRFYLPEQPATDRYLVISSVDLGNPSAVLDRKVLVSGASDFYVSQEAIYITNQTYFDQETITEIIKFHYEDGRILGVAASSVKGYLNNSFSLNEYEGNLRVVSTYYDEEWNEWNALYILDENLVQLSCIEDLAKGETIRSARFLGDTGYFVTFRQTDPLFSVDLSDPSNPQIRGELKISGFSSYLHFYGENRLLGIGYEADEETGITSGLKLSMFDISDPANVTEISRFVLPGITWCPAIEDYKSILVDPQKNLIGFFCDQRYFVYSYDEEAGFQRELLYDFYSDDLTVMNSEDASDGSQTQTGNSAAQTGGADRQADGSTDRTNGADRQTDGSTDQTDGADRQTDGSTDQTENSTNHTDDSGEQTADTEEPIDISADVVTPSAPVTVDYSNMRGLYIKDTLYLAGNHFVISFDMNDGFAKQNVYTFR